MGTGLNQDDFRPWSVISSDTSIIKLSLRLFIMNDTWTFITSKVKSIIKFSNNILNFNHFILCAAVFMCLSNAKYAAV